MRQVKLPKRLRFVVVQISLQTSKVEGQEYEQYAVSILVSQGSWEIKRMRMQLIPGSPFPLPPRAWVRGYNQMYLGKKEDIPVCTACV